MSGTHSMSVAQPMTSNIEHFVTTRRCHFSA